MPATQKTLRIQYYASLREVCGSALETRKTMARTATDLYEELQRAYKIKIPKVLIHLAINNQFSDWNVNLRDGDCIALLPPGALAELNRG